MEDFKSRFMNIVNHSNKSNDNSVGVYIIHIFSCPVLMCVCVCVCLVHRIIHEFDRLTCFHMEDFKSIFMNIVNHSNKSNDNSVGVYIIHIFSCPVLMCVCVCLVH
jgi:type IV secretory pathway protease TraF